MTTQPTAERSIAVVGRGVVGNRVVKRLALLRPDIRIVELDTRLHDVASTPLLADAAVAVLAQPAPHLPNVAKLIDRNIAVVSIGDDVADVRALLALDTAARRARVPIVVGGGMSPGLTLLLARHLAAPLAGVDEIHVAVHGTAGPACARQHHRALAGTATALMDGVEVEHRAGTGRELCWFPEPVGAYDCYWAELPGALMVRRAFPDVERLSMRMSATRRDRLTSRLPMLAPPHAEGGVGAVRVEVRGSEHDGARTAVIAGIAELVGTASAATATAFADAALEGRLEPGVVTPGDEALDTEGLLRAIERLGVRLQEFTGVPTA